MQLSEGLNLDAEVDSKVQSFVDLNMGEKMSIVQALKAGAKSDTSSEWGFLKNIINIDRFFSSDVDGSTTGSDESEPDTASEADRAAARRRAEERLRKAREEAKKLRDKANKDKAELERLRKEKEAKALEKKEEERLRDLEEQKKTS